MYSNLKHIQLLVSMLKTRGIANIVISPGNSHNAIVRSLENDAYFKTYNIIDERSAAFFAIGLCQEMNVPIALCCTAGTAVSNYLSGVTEAHRRKLPLVVITADKNPYYLGQDEDQMIDQVSMLEKVIKYTCTTPIIKDSKDEWYCSRILNEAYLEMNHHGKGPVQINVPIEEGKLAIGYTFTSKSLPIFNLINRLDLLKKEDVEKITSIFRQLKDKKILFLCGQDYHIEKEEVKLIESVFSKYNCIFATDKLSNIYGTGIMQISKAALYHKRNIESLVPDIVISIAGNTALDFKFSLKNPKYSFKHWIINDDGKIADPFKKLSMVFEGSTVEFLRAMDSTVEEKIDSHSYFDLWKKENDKFQIPDFEFSNLYAVKALMNKIPLNSILNLGNSTTIRIAQFFNLDESVQVYCNRGVNGIDGNLSTFIGQSAATDKLSFLIIGDLSFFYDMNGMWNRYVGKNVRIMLINNEGASLFHFNQGLQQYPTLNENVAAEHFTTAKGWIESLGIKYLCARKKEEFEECIEEFLSDSSEGPVFFEVFTHKDEDARLQHEFYDMNQAPVEGSEKMKQVFKKAAYSVLGQDMIHKIKGNR